MLSRKIEVCGSVPMTLEKQQQGEERKQCGGHHRSARCLAAWRGAAGACMPACRLCHGGLLGGLAGQHAGSVPVLCRRKNAGRKKALGCKSSKPGGCNDVNQGLCQSMSLSLRPASLPSPVPVPPPIDSSEHKANLSFEGAPRICGAAVRELSKRTPGTQKGSNT